MSLSTFRRDIFFLLTSYERTFSVVESTKSSWIFHESDGVEIKGKVDGISSFVVANIKIPKRGKWKVEWRCSMRK